MAAPDNVVSMSDTGKRFDVMPAIGVGISVVMAVVYVVVVHGQGNPIAVWFLTGLIVAAVVAGYGAYRDAPRRGIALVVAGVLLCGLGLVGILSIGLPIVVAAVLILIGAGRAFGSRAA